MEFAGVIAIWIAIAAVVVVVIYVGRVYEKKRQEGLSKVATEMGLSYSHGLDPADEGLFQRFHLPTLGHGKVASNAIVADSGSLRMVIFDYKYTTGSGKNQSTHKQSVVLASAETLALPGFTISPERFFHRIAEFFGSNDIDFEDDPDFSKRFLLHGTDEAAVREFFTKERRRAFLDREQLVAEGGGHNFIFYSANKRRKPEETKKLMEEAFEVFGILSN